MAQGDEKAGKTAHHLGSPSALLKKRATTGGIRVGAVDNYRRIRTLARRFGSLRLSGGQAAAQRSAA